VATVVERPGSGGGLVISRTVDVGISGGVPCCEDAELKTPWGLHSVTPGHTRYSALVPYGRAYEIVFECDNTKITERVAWPGKFSALLKKRRVVTSDNQYRSYLAAGGRSVLRWRARQTGRAYIGVSNPGFWVLKSKGHRVKCHGLKKSYALCSIPVKAKTTYTATHSGSRQNPALIGSWVE
jgi:hypothetical protein